MYGKHFNTGGQGGIVFGIQEDYYGGARRRRRGKPFGLPAGSTNRIAAINCNLDELGNPSEESSSKSESFGAARRVGQKKLGKLLPLG